MSIFVSGAITQKSADVEQREAEVSKSDNQIIDMLKSRIFDSLSECAPLPSAHGVVNIAPPIVVVCFGTMNISGDALGPMVGTLLREKYNIDAFVYGTQERAITGANMKEWIDFIRRVHPDATLLAIDASLGEKAKVGQIVLRADGVCPAAVKGKKSRFGDVGLLGVVGENKGDALMQLLQVSPLYVDKMADKISKMVKSALLSE